MFFCQHKRLPSLWLLAPHCFLTHETTSDDLVIVWVSTDTLILSLPKFQPFSCTFQTMIIVEYFQPLKVFLTIFDFEEKQFLLDNSQIESVVTASTHRQTSSCNISFFRAFCLTSFQFWKFCLVHAKTRISFLHLEIWLWLIRSLCSLIFQWHIVQISS